VQNWRGLCRVIAGVGFAYASYFLTTQITIIALHSWDSKAPDYAATASGHIIGAIVFISLLLRDVANGINRN